MEACNRAGLASTPLGHGLGSMRGWKTRTPTCYKSPNSDKIGGIMTATGNIPDRLRLSDDQGARMEMMG